MGLNSGGATRRLSIELVIVVAVFAAGTGLGAAMLKSHRTPEGQSCITCPTSFLARSVMIAAGRGSFHPEIEAVPGLLPFLKHEVNTYDPSPMPKDIPAFYDSAAEYHLYLGWAVAAVWRAFGVSWLVLEPCLALALGLCGVFAYGLFRLGMNRWLSLSCTALFATSPAVLYQLNNMRDFSKAPFLLAGMFAIGWLVTRRAPVRFLWLIVALMGVLAGAGMGFRQDAIILVPVSLAGILILSPGVVYRTLLRRAGAALVYLLAFLAAASPMLVRMEGGAQPYHPLAQGYSMRHMDRCSLEPGICEPLASSHDNFIFATAFSYARRATGNNQNYYGYSDPEDSRFTRDWVIRTGLQFPADTIARGYGAVLNVLSDADACMTTLFYDGGWQTFLAEMHRRIAVFFRLAGVPIAVLAVLAAAAASPLIAIALVLLTFYFCGYVSLDNEWRHTFHLAFVCFWAAGFLLQQTFSGLKHSFRGTAQWRRWLCRAGAFFILGSLTLWLPWQAARLWQQRTLGDVIRQYASAPRTPSPTAPEPMQDLTLFRLTDNTSSAARYTRLGKVPFLGTLLRGVPPRHWDASCSLYALHLRARQAGHLFLAKYWAAEEEGAPNDFTQVMRVAGAEKDGGETWFFFPVYEFADRTMFEGIALPQENADDFLGLYRVEDSAQPILLPCVTLNEPDGRERLTAGIDVPYDLARRLTPENEYGQIVQAGEDAVVLGCLDPARFYLRMANALKPAGEPGRRIADLYEKVGQTQNALRLLKSTIVSSGGDAGSCTAMKGFLERNASEFSAPSVWEEVAQQMPSRYVWQFYEQSIGEKDVEKRIYVLRQLLRAAPEALNYATQLQNLLADQAEKKAAAGDLPGALTTYREAIPLNPRNNQPVLGLEKALDKSGPAERRDIWESVWKDNPDHPLVASICGTVRAATGNLAGAKEAFATARRIAPEEWYYCVLAADALAAAKAWSDAAETYERALALNPKLDYLHGRLDEAKRRAAEGSAPAENTAPPPAAP